MDIRNKSLGTLAEITNKKNVIAESESESVDLATSARGVAEAANPAAATATTEQPGLPLVDVAWEWDAG